MGMNRKILNWIRRTLTLYPNISSIDGRGKRRAEKIQLPPPESLVYGVFLALAFFFALIALQIIYILVFREWSEAVWNGISFTLGVVLTAFFVHKGR
jgi:hypothetical protein